MALPLLNHLKQTIMKQTTISACLKINYQAITYTVLLCTLLSLSPFVGNTQMVTSSADDINDTNSLRSIIANALDGATIQFAANLDTIKLLSTISFSKELSFVGISPTNTVIDGSLQTNNPQLFRMTSPDSVVFANMSFVNSGNASSTQWGGAMNYNNTTGKLKLLNCVFDNNEAYLGGAIRMQEGSLLMDRCRFSNNKSDILGGAINTRGGQEHFAYNCLFYKNESGSSGGSIQNEDAQWNIYNSTFTKNTAATSGGAYKGNGLQDVINNIFYVNTGASGPNLSSNSPTNASQNLIGDFANSGITAGLNGNFSTNPNFADEATDDYHLSFNSPWINEGITYAGIMNPYTNDLDNVRRQLNGFPELGCYEFDNELCDDAIYLEAGISHRATNQDATPQLTLSPTSLCMIDGDGDYDFNAELFYRFNGDGNTYLVTTDLPQTKIDTDMVIFTKDNNNIPTCVDADNDSGQNNLTSSSILLETVNGTEYFIAVGGHDHATGTFEISRNACDASFSINGTTSAMDTPYNSISFCSTDADPSINITGSNGGNYSSSTMGLAISNDVIDLDLSIGTHILSYTDLAGCTESIELIIEAPAASAGDADVLIKLSIGSTQVVNFRTELTGEDGGGTWSSVTQPPPSGYGVIQDEAQFDTDGAPIGYYEFSYTQTNAAPCGGQVRTVTIQITPENDDICNATVLTVAAEGSDLDCNGANPYTLNFSSHEVGEIDVSCGSGGISTSQNTIKALQKKSSINGGSHSVWFKFVAPASGVVNISIDHPQSSLPVEVISLSLWQDLTLELQQNQKKSVQCPSIQDMEELNCASDNGWEVCSSAIINQGDLNNGETYYIKVESGFSDIDFCLTVADVTIPVNIDPTNAISLNISPDNTCSVANSGTTRGGARQALFGPYFEIENTSASTKYYEVLYQHQGESKEVPDIALGFTDQFFSFFYPSPSTLEVDANSTSQLTVMPMRLTTLNEPVNNFEFNFIETNFNLCVYECTPPQNHIESNAEPLMLSNANCQNQVSGNTACTIANKVFYSFTPSSDGNYIFTADGTDMNVYTPSGGGFINSVGSNDEELTVSLTANTAYIISLQTLIANIEFYAPTTFDLCVRSCADTPPVNDLCADAIPLILKMQEPMNQGCSNFSVITLGESACMDFNYGCATHSGVPDADDNCGGVSGSSGYRPGFDQWYSVTVPESGVLEISINDINANQLSASTPSFTYELFEGTCGSLSQIGCFTNNSNWTGLSPGTTLYIRLWQIDGNVGSSGTLCINSGFFVNDCPTTLDLEGIIAGTSNMSTQINTGLNNSLISSSQLVTSTADVTYNSGYEIDLEEGFEVEAGASFHAYIEGCGGFFVSNQKESATQHQQLSITERIRQRISTLSHPPTLKNQ